ncbi:hypothetical protein [Flavihumibacter sp. UBA7668]|uniref:hypothetical protein n=1 Tax=Flavihumibacter sp. UBA7668 TaxID=1946542 RepID=UPI0025BCD1E9|nr:hypothetical protein [Flavihumibacter sp. UBA7668]
MSTETLQEKTLLLANGTGWPYLEEELGRINIYPVLSGSNNAFTFFMDHLPSIEESVSRIEPERATASIRLSMNLPESATGGYVLRTMTTLQIVLQNESGNQALLEKNFSGTETQLQLSVPANAANAFLKATRQEKSGLILKIRSEVYISSSQHQYTIRSQVSLEELLHVFENYQVSFKYFDPVYNNYRLIPEQIKGNEATRSINPPIAGKLERGSIVNANFAQLSTASLPLLSIQKQEQLVFDTKINLHRLENWTIALTGQEKIKDYPIITDASSRFWLNRRNEQEVLALPEFRILVPDLQTSPDQSAFRFSFQNTGLTDTGGKPVLEGSLHITVDCTISEAVKAEALAAHPGKTIRPIRLDQVNYLLEIPYVNDQQETVKLSLVPSEMKSGTGEQTQLVFRLLNNAIRMCYAAISGTEPKLTLQVMLAFTGYSKVEPQLLQLQNIVGAKISQIKPNRSFRPALASAIKLNAHILSQPITHLQPVVLAQLIEPTVKYKKQSYIRSQSIELHFPCVEYGQYYLEETAGASTAIGCKEAYKLGEISPSFYSPVPDLDTDQYKLFRSTNVPNDFLVVPTNYIIGRQQVEEEGKEVFKPMILLYSTLDAVTGTSKWVLDATLIPDLNPETRYDLEQVCARLTPYPPNLHYLTEIPAGSAESVLSLDHMTGTSTRIVPYGKFIRLTVETDISSILILLEMLERDAINGLFTTVLSATEKYTSRLQPGLQKIGGEWLNGHASISYDGAGQLKLLNRTENRLQFSGILAKTSTGAAIQLELLEEIEGFASLEKTIPEDQYLGFIPQYQVIDASPIELEQINNYIEDVQCQVIFLSTTDFNEEQLAGAEITYKLKSSTGENMLELTAQERSREVYIQMPVTNFLLERVIEYRISKLVKSDQTETVVQSAFIEQDLSDKGNIIYINL